jgi:hypothetical protein
VLYNRDPVLRRVGELVGLDYVYERRLRLGDDRDVPVVLATGVTGAGRSSLLAALATRYRNRTALGHLDLAAHRAGGGAGSLVPLLDRIVWDLTRSTRDTGQLKLPRLMLALFAISLWPPGRQLTVAEATALARQATDQVTGWFDGDEGHRVAGEVLGSLTTAIPTAVPGPVGVLATAGIRIFVRTVLTRGQARTALSWWQRHRPGSDGDGEQKVRDVAGDFHAGEGFREDAELDLVAALLADLRARFGDQHTFRTRRPLLLIDNLDRDPAGPRLLDLVLKNRRTARDPLVLVASALPRQAAHPVPVEQVPAARHTSPLVVTLDPLRWHEDCVAVFNELYRESADRADELRQRLGTVPHLIHRLSDGLPLAVSTLARAVVGQQKGDRALDPWALLDLPVPGAAAPEQPPVSVAERLLRLLVPDGEIRDDLVLFAAAEDAEAATVLAAWQLPADRRGLAVDRAVRFLGERTRPAPCARFLVADPLLRTVLLHRLRTGGTATGAGWDEVHGRLHAHYAGANPGGTGTGPLGRQEPSRLRHALSLGREQQVADRLAAAFDPSDGRAWLGALAFVAGAPCRNRLTRRAGTDDARDPDRVHRAITRLDRTAGPGAADRRQAGGYRPAAVRARCRGRVEAVARAVQGGRGERLDLPGQRRQPVGQGGADRTVRPARAAFSRVGLAGRPPAGCGVQRLTTAG